MIIWKDFILDGVMGPLLLMPEGTLAVASINASSAQSREKNCRTERLGSDASVMDDAKQIQETGQEKRLARMAGHSSLESKTGMEAGRDNYLAESSLRARREEA